MNNFFPRSWSGHTAESCAMFKHLVMEEMYVAKKYNCFSVFENFQEEVRSFPEVFKWQAPFIHKIILWALAFCFGICFALMSWLHPAGLIRETTPDNLSCHMWCSPLYMHLQWTTINILPEPPVPTAVWTQAGKLSSNLHFCFVLLTWTQSSWEPPQCQPWHGSTAHGHTGHVGPEQREQSEELPHSCNDISCLNRTRTFGLCPSSFGLWPVCKSAFSLSSKTDNRSAH